MGNLVKLRWGMGTVGTRQAPTMVGRIVANDELIEVKRRNSNDGSLKLNDIKHSKHQR
jgi:hypothetical protein